MPESAHPDPSTPHLPRFEAVTRRWLLAAGGIGALAVLDACGHDDAAMFANAPKITVGGGATSTSATTATTQAGNQTTTTVAPGNTNAVGVTTTAPPAVSGTPLPASAQLNLTFTFQAADGGFQVRNPYICVWIEDTKGHIVQNVAIWYGQPRYVQHLTRWYNAELGYLNGGGTDNTAAVSGSTRPAGQYQLKWDGTNVNGQRVAQGEYVLCIEAAREHGPYSLITGNISVADKKATFTFPDNSELVGATAEYVI